MMRWLLKLLTIRRAADEQSGFYGTGRKKVSGKCFISWEKLLYQSILNVNQMKRIRKDTRLSMPSMKVQLLHQLPVSISAPNSSNAWKQKGSGLPKLPCIPG